MGEPQKNLGPSQDPEYVEKALVDHVKRSRRNDALARFKSAVLRIPAPSSRGAKGPGLTRDRLKAINAKADGRQVLMAMRREMPETDHDVARIQAAVDKRHRRQVRNMLTGKNGMWKGQVWE